MALRIRSRWHDDSATRSWGQLASALAFNAWRIAKDKAIALHGANFVYETDEQRMEVIAEYLCFQVQVIDRLTHRVLNDDGRSKLVSLTARNLAGHMQENSEDLFGPGEYRRAFVDRLNDRGREYAEYDLPEDGPSYPFYRHLGFEVQQIMGAAQENRWVIDQVMDRDGPEVWKQISRVVRDLLG